MMELKENSKFQHILATIPSIIMWELWKTRNSGRHNKDISYHKMYYHCELTIHHLIKMKFPWMKNIPLHWEGMFDMLKGYKPKLYYSLVKCNCPEDGWVKCNTNGASKGNPGLSLWFLHKKL